MNMSINSSWIPVPVVILTLALPAIAQDDVILNPGTLYGSVSLIGYEITSVTVRSIDTNKEYSATVTVDAPGGASSIDYVLTVEGDRDYYVIADVVVLAPETTRAVFPVTGPVSVPIGDNVFYDLSMRPAIISGAISTGSDSDTIEGYNIVAYITSPEFGDYLYSSWAYASGLSVPGDTGCTYTLLLAPGAEFSYVRAFIDIDGLRYTFMDYDVIAPAAGVTVTRDYTINVSGATISGTAILQGIDVTYAYVHGVAGSPTRYVNPVINDISTGQYTCDVDAGSWRLQPIFYFNLPDPLSSLDGRLVAPLSPAMDISPGDQLTDLDFIVDPGFIPGTLRLWGANTDIRSAYVEAYTPVSGYAGSDVDPDTGEFMFVCSPGDWQVDYFQRLYFDYPDDSDPSLFSDVWQYHYDTSDQTAVASGQTTPSVELTYGTITVRRYFYVAGGGTLSSPHIRAIRHDQPYSQAEGTGSSLPTTEGQAIVTLLLPGTYTIEAFAEVNGSDTEFGNVEVTVDEGDVVVIGGTECPTVKVTNPTNNQTIYSNKVTVEGTATDDVGVASIKINGEDVAFASTGNPDDPEEVGFSHDIILSSCGENTITVIVTDEDQSEPTVLTMTVIRDCGPDAIECPVDIKPRSCPNPFNVESRGVLPIAIVGTDEFDVTHVDLATVQLMLVDPVRGAYEDVCTAYLPLVGKASQYDCTEEGPDGCMDLTLKFDCQVVAEALEMIGGPLTDGEEVLVTLTGNLLPEYGGTPIQGEDVIRIIKKGE